LVSPMGSLTSNPAQVVFGAWLVAIQPKTKFVSYFGRFLLLSSEL